MLKIGQIRDGEQILGFNLEVRGSSRLPLAFKFWMAELARDHLRVGVYFSALGVMLQVPGGAGFEWVAESELDDYTHDHVRQSDEDELLDVLADCFKRLDAPGALLQQVPGGAEHEPREVSAEWKQFLDERDAFKKGLLNVVAECLDELIVRPGMAEIDEQPTPHWWNRWRPEPL